MVWAVASIVGLGAGCAEMDEDELGRAELAVANPVTWQGLVGVTANGNDLTKSSAGTGWLAGASSVESFSSDGYIEFTTAEANTAKMAGLSAGDNDQSYQNINFAVYLKATGTVAVYERGVSRGNFGAYAAGDVFRVEVTSDVVTYARNGAVFYTSAQEPFFPIGVDTSFRTPGGTINDVVIESFPFWDHVVGASAVDNDLIKTSGVASWTAGAVSVESLSGDGYVEFTTGESTTKAKMAGLGNGNASQSYTDIEYAVYLKSNGVFGVYESGVLKGANFGTYVFGDVFRVETTAGVVTYSKNGVPFYTSQTPSVPPLLLDVSLYTPAATIYDADVVSAP